MGLSSILARREEFGRLSEGTKKEKEREERVGCWDQVESWIKGEEGRQGKRKGRETYSESSEGGFLMEEDKRKKGRTRISSRSFVRSDATRLV